MLSLRIAVRFLRKSIVQTGLIVLGIAVGIAVLIFIGSLISSLQGYLINQTLGSSPHLVVTDSAQGKPVVFGTSLRRTFAGDPNISLVLPQRTVAAIAVNGLAPAPLTIRSGQPDKMDQLYKIAPKIVKGVYILNKSEVVIGKGLADNLGLQPGRTMVLTLAGDTHVGLRVTGVADFGIKQLNDTLAFAGPDFGQAALGLKDNEYSAVLIQLKDVFQSKSDTARIERSVSGVAVADWQVEQKDLLSGLSAQSSSTYLIQFFVLLAVALGIASTLSISAIQKTRQIGILKALGMTDAKAGRVFLWQGLILGLAGSAAGLLLGLGLIAGFTLGTSSSSSSFPITAQPGFIALSVGIGVAVAMISSILPSRRTARLDPIEVIQSGG
jgi:lipoprotein-releasing system permease protein